MSERRAEFERDGFIVVPGFASVSACEQLRDAAEALVAAADIEAIHTTFDVHEQRHAEDPWFLESGGEVRAFLEPERDHGQARVNKLGHALHDRVPIFDQFSRTPQLAALVAEFGVVEPLPLQSMVIFKHPRVGGEVVPHQDATYLYTEPSCPSPAQPIRSRCVGAGLRDFVGLERQPQALDRRELRGRRGTRCRLAAPASVGGHRGRGRLGRATCDHRALVALICVARTPGADPRQGSRVPWHDLAPYSDGAASTFESADARQGPGLHARPRVAPSGLHASRFGQG